MPIAICIKCGNPLPSGFYNHKKICTCKTKEEWIEYLKKNNFQGIINNKLYDFCK